MNNLKNIKFGPLPPSNRAGSKKKTTAWSEIAELLRTRPNEWARIAVTHGSNRAWDINHGKRGFALGEYEATTRIRQDGKFDLWARYVGPVETRTATAIAETQDRLKTIINELHGGDLIIAVADTNTAQYLEALS